MSLRVALTFPPHHEGRVAEIHDTDGESTSVPVELFLSAGVATVALGSSPDGAVWEGKLSDLMVALSQGLAVLEEGIDAIERFRS